MSNTNVLTNNADELMLEIQDSLAKTKNISVMRTAESDVMYSTGL